MQAKYDVIGKGYNRTRRADPYIAGRMLDLLNPTKNGKYFEIGCGTGNYTSYFYHRGFDFIGIDPSNEMLEQARAKHPDMDWRNGNAEKTGLPDGCMNGVVASLTIHHWPDLEKAFLELARVLKNDGRIVIFTSTPEQMKGYWLNHYFPQLMAAGIKQMPALEVVAEALQQSGFHNIITEKYAVQPDLQDQFLYIGKYHPGIYFRPEIRAGISTFADLGNKTEVEAGLAKLRKDIETGEVQSVIDSYEHNEGDYLFIAADKKFNLKN